MCAKASGNTGTFGGAAAASASSAWTSRSLAGPDARTTCHGWMFEFDGARIARSSASVTSPMGTGLLRRNIRTDRRSVIARSKSYMATS